MPAPNPLPRIVGNVLSVFEDPVGLARPLGRDYSKYQGYVDHPTALANGVLFMAARAGISWGYKDPFFDNNWIGAGLVGMYRTSYHVPYPDQPLIRQADSWYFMHPTIDIIPRVIDLELKRDQSYPKIGDFTWQMSELVLSRDGVRPIIYSRYLLINDWLRRWTDSMLNNHFWWLAQYKWDRSREHPGPPTLPQRVKRERVVMHQTADKKRPPPGEVQSLSVAWNRWEIGNEMQMHQWIRNEWGDGDTPPPPRNDWFTDVDAAIRTNFGLDLEPLPPPAHVHNPEV